MPANFISEFPGLNPFSITGQLFSAKDPWFFDMIPLITPFRSYIILNKCEYLTSMVFIYFLIPFWFFYFIHGHWGLGVDTHWKASRAWDPHGMSGNKTSQEVPWKILLEKRFISNLHYPFWNPHLPDHLPHLS